MFEMVPLLEPLLKSKSVEEQLAGALALALGGPREYLGGVVKTQWIGDGNPRATSQDIERALLLYGVTGLLHMLFYATLATMWIQ